MEIEQAMAKRKDILTAVFERLELFFDSYLHAGLQESAEWTRGVKLNEIPGHENSAIFFRYFKETGQQYPVVEMLISDDNEDPGSLGGISLSNDMNESKRLAVEKLREFFSPRTPADTDKLRGKFE